MNLISYSKWPNSLFFLHFWASAVNTQAVDPDNINFKTIAVWKDLKSCLTANLFGDCFISCTPFWAYLGCHTNACLCRPDTLGAAINFVFVAAFSDYSDFQDQSTGISVLTAYCAAKGYTSIVTPTILQSSGACTITATAAGFVPTPATKTQVVTAYVTVYVSGSTCSRLSSYGGLASVGVAFALAMVLGHMM